MRDAIAGIGNELRRLRQEMGISRNKLAKAAHVDPAYVSGIEQGARTVSAEVAQRLAGALGVGFRALMQHGRCKYCGGPHALARSQEPGKED